MKKNVIILFGILLIFTGCSKKEVPLEEKYVTASDKALVITQDTSDEEYLSYKELVEIYNENEARFKKKYAGAYISFVGTVESINSYFTVSGGSTIYDSITFKEGYELYLSYDEFKLISDLQKGDLVYIKSNIYSMFAGIRLQGTGGSTGSSSADRSLTIVEVVNDLDKNDFDNLVKVLDEETKLYETLHDFKYDLKQISNECSEIIPRFSLEEIEKIKNYFSSDFDYSLLSNRYPDLKQKIKDLNDSKDIIYNYLFKAINNKENLDIPSYSSAKSEANSALIKTEEILEEVKEKRMNN